MTTHRPTRPRFPFFKDETGRGWLSSHITLKASLRAVIIAVVLAVIVIGIVVWYAVDKVTQIDRLVAERHNDNAATQAQIEKVIDQNKQDAFNAVAQLACSVVALYPPGTSSYLDGLSKTYSCPPYEPRSSQTGSAPTPTPTPTPSGQKSAHDSPTPHAGGPALSPTVDKTVDSPTVTPTPTPPMVIVPTPLINLGSVTCEVLGLLC